MKIGIAQIDIALNDKSSNLNKCEKWIQQAQQAGVEILVFPECTLTGYVYKSREEAMQVAETVPGDLSANVIKLCAKYQITVVLGLLEKDQGVLYNTALLIDPKGIIGKYRKTHLIYLGVDRYTTNGDNIAVFDLPQGKVALLICYDMRFPEAARVAALQGAQVILSPTNLPQGAEVYANFINQTRACENRVFLVSANRVGVERGVQFIGKSQIIGTGGQILAQGSPDAEELLIADVAMEQALIKKTVNSPGEYEYDIFNDRQPALYKEVIKTQD